MSISKASTVGLGLVALALLGSACVSSGSDVDRAESDLGNVNEVVVSESTDEDGVTERLIVTLGDPASLNLAPVELPGELVAPWMYDPGESCAFDEFPQPVTEYGSGVAQQSGVYVAYFAAEFETAAAAQDAQSAVGWCYTDYSAALASDLGRSPGTTDLEQRQEMAIDGGVEIESRVTPPSFGDPGPVVFTVRSDRTVGFLVDLDNALDIHDGQNLAGELIDAAD